MWTVTGVPMSALTVSCVWAAQPLYPSRRSAPPRHKIPICPGIKSPGHAVEQEATKLQWQSHTMPFFLLIEPAPASCQKLWGNAVLIILSHKRCSCIYHGLHWTFASASKHIYQCHWSGKNKRVPHENGSERKQPCIFWGIGRKGYLKRAGTGQIMTPMYNTVITSGFPFFFFFCLFALPQLLRTRISYTTAFQGEELLKKGEMLLCCGTSEQCDAYAEEKT